MILQNIFVLVAVSRGFTRGTWKASFPPFLLCGNPHLSSSFQRPSGSNVGSSAHQCCCEGGSRRETLRFEGRTTNPPRHVHNKTLTSGTQDHKASSQCVSCVDCKVTGTTHCGLLRRRLEGDCANRQTQHEFKDVAALEYVGTPCGWWPSKVSWRSLLCSAENTQRNTRCVAILAVSA